MSQPAPSKRPAVKKKIGTYLGNSDTAKGLYKHTTYRGGHPTQNDRPGLRPRPYRARFVLGHTNSFCIVNLFFHVRGSHQFCILSVCKPSLSFFSPSSLEQHGGTSESAQLPHCVHHPQIIPQTSDHAFPLEPAVTKHSALFLADALVVEALPETGAECSNLASSADLVMSVSSPDCIWSVPTSQLIVKLKFDSLQPARTAGIDVYHSLRSFA